MTDGCCSVIAETSVQESQYVTIQEETDVMCQNGGFHFLQNFVLWALKIESRNHSEVSKLKIGVLVSQKCKVYFEKKKSWKNVQNGYFRNYSILVP